MKKTNRKNKTGLTVNWPTGFYTMEPSKDQDHASVSSLLSQNTDFVKITLRVRLNNAIEDKTVSVIGTLKGGKGRPKLVFANAPVSKATLEAASKVKGFSPMSETADTSIVNVVDVKPTDSRKTEAKKEATVNVPTIVETKTVNA